MSTENTNENLREKFGRFRILIIGRANAGKTTILRGICNMTENPEIYDGEGNKIDPSQVEGSMGRGLHNIENELIFRSNDQFIFHDSQGFEAGREDEFLMAKKFIADRTTTTRLEKRLHMIWYCIPMDKLDRAIQRSEERFFDECDPGNVPIMVLFTKFDTLLPVALGKLPPADRRLPLQERLSKAKLLIEGIFNRADPWGRLSQMTYPPKACVQIGGMHKSNDGCSNLLESSVTVLAEEAFQATQETNIVEGPVHNTEKKSLARFLYWFPHFQKVGVYLTLKHIFVFSDRAKELARINNNFDTFKAQHATVQQHNLNLLSALFASKGMVFRANQRILTLQSDLQTAQHNNSNLQSALDTQTEVVVKANQTISNVKSALRISQDEAEILKADYDTKVTRLQHDKFDLLSELGSLKREVVEDKLRLSLGIADFEQWMCMSSVNAGTLISVPDPLTSLSDIHHVLVHNALVRIGSENWSSAYEDAQKSIVTRPSAMGYIAKALAQIGMGEPEDSMQVFDLAFRNCNPTESNLLLLIKAIILFVARKHDTAISRIHDLMAVSTDDETMYCYIQVLGKMYLMQGDYACGVQSLERGQGLASSCTGSALETISLIFGWTFDGLRITVQRYHCEDLYASGHVEEATEALLKILDNFSDEICASKGTTDWVMDLKRKYINALETLGDTAVSSGEHDNAIARYTFALSLDPANPVNILVKRSKAQSSMELWNDALIDANEVIKRDPSSHLGYERKYAALHGAEHYVEANNALRHMLSIIENSPTEEIRRLRANYTNPCETIAAIDTAIHEIFNLCPLVLIDVTTGRLCDAEEWVRMFKSETPFEKIISETAVTKIDRALIRQSVAKYFKWIMFSHTWEGKEPTFKDVNLVDSVWKLDGSPLNEKLRQFCTTASEDGHRWAWSDTCCIDKTTSAILSQSLIAMYTWYEKAAETLVYLADVLSSAEIGDLALTKSRWMTRAWTLQELLASKVIRFYNRDWKLYLNDTHTNHKESPEIKQELAKAMGVAPETITSFQPEDLGVREKLRLASTRNATMEEDNAYSLIGIFSSNIVPRYGLGKTALGELLENIVARTGDVTVIAWTGKSLPYNSALPASLAAYSQAPYSLPPMENNELDTCVEPLRTQLAPGDATSFYYRVIHLPRANFTNRCLQLPCIVFYVTKIGVQELGRSQGTHYRAKVSLLGNVEFRTADAIPLKKPRKIAFVHPWLRDLRDPLDGFISDDELEADSDVDSSDEADSEAKSDVGSGAGTDDASAPASPLHAEPSVRMDPSTQALRLIARLGRPFNALLFEQQSNGQYKRIAAEEEIIVPGVPYKTNPKDIKVKVLEVV